MTDEVDRNVILYILVQIKQIITHKQLWMMMKWKHY